MVGPGDRLGARAGIRPSALSALHVSEKSSPVRMQAAPERRECRTRAVSPGHTTLLAGMGSFARRNSPFSSSCDPRWMFAACSP